MDENEIALPKRSLPCRDQHRIASATSIVFITVCTKERAPILANETVHAVLRELWSDASHWRVGPYVILKDHIHLAAAEATRPSSPIRAWVGWWKQRSSMILGLGPIWQKSLWDVRIRSADHFTSRITYMRQNPVLHGLVTEPSEWAYQGEIYRIAV